MSKKIMSKIETGYRFEEKGHSHWFNGERMTGITTVLSVIAKPALISWAANMAVDYIDEKLPVKRDNNVLSVDADDFKRILEEARKAHTRKKETAGEKGKDIHALIEERIKGAIKNNNGMIDPQAIDENDQIQKFIEWTQDNKVKFLESELHLYSESKFLGGVCDFVAEIDGEKWIGDIKTGGVYPEAFYQMAGYQILMEEMKIYPDIKGHIVIGLKNGELVEKRSISNEDNQAAFLSALSLYRITQKVNGQIL